MSEEIEKMSADIVPVANAVAFRETELSIFGQKLIVSAARVEYNSLRARFKKLADEQLVEALTAIEKAGEDVDEFCKSGDQWAHQYLDKAADLAVEVLMEKGCYDLDRRIFVSKFLNTTLWDSPFRALSKAVAEVDAEEEEREEGRQERWNNAGNWVGLNEAGERSASSKNLQENVMQGTLNILGRGIYAVANSRKKKSLFKDAKEELLDGIHETIRTAVDELLDCLEECGKGLPDAKVNKLAREKASSLFNNLKTGKMGADVLVAAKMEILALNPYRADFYEYVYTTEGDNRDELSQVANFFGCSLDKLKAEAFGKKLGKCEYKTEEETIAYRSRAVQIGKEIYFDPTEKLAEIDAQLKIFDEKARTVDGRMFETREEAALQCKLSEFEKKLDLSTEEIALASRKSLEAKIAELGIDGTWKLERVDRALKKFDELARTTFGILLETREKAKEALGDRELFYKGIEATVKATGEDVFYTSETIPEKKITNARATFPIPVDEFVLALTDTTLFGSGKTGLAVTKWGLRWANKSGVSFVTAISWEDFANVPTAPVDEDNAFTITQGGLYLNGGSGVDEPKMKKFLETIYSYCKLATFFVKKSADELAAEENALPFRTRVEGILRTITDTAFFVGDRIPEKKRKNATKSCMVDDGDEILALIDSTLFGTAATALVVTERGVYWHNKENVGKCFIPWDKMSTYKDTMRVSEGNRLVFSQGNSFKGGSVDHEKVKNIFIQIGDLAKPSEV